MTLVSRRLGDDERWPPGQPDVHRCACGTPARFREGRRPDVPGVELVDERLVCLAHSDGTTRISCDLPNKLLARLETQSRTLVVGRTYLIETAIEGLVREFEQIDADTAVPARR